MENIKTLHLIGSKNFGGAENWFFRFTRALLEYGIEVYRGVRAGSELLKDSPKNIPVFPLPFYTTWDPISKMSISRLIRRIEPDIVQTYMSRATRLTMVSPKKCVHIARLGGYYGLKAFKKAHAWIGNTKGICDYLIQNGFPKNRIFYITNFVDIPQKSSKGESLIKKLTIPDESFIILTPARFVPVKGHHTLIGALCYLLNDGEIKRDIRVILPGDGPLLYHIKRHATSLGIKDKLIFPGWQKNISIYYEIADLIVFPSMENETLGNVILEAWAHKKPVVCTKFRGAREITKDMVDVIQTECGDEKRLYYAIKTAILDDSLRRYISENGYKNIVQKYTKEKIVKQYIEVYKLLLGNF